MASYSYVPVIHPPSSFSSKGLAYSHHIVLEGQRGGAGFVRAQSVSRWSREGRRTHEAVRSELRRMFWGSSLFLRKQYDSERRGYFTKSPKNHPNNFSILHFFARTVPYGPHTNFKMKRRAESTISNVHSTHKNRYLVSYSSSTWYVTAAVCSSWYLVRYYYSSSYLVLRLRK